jgi:hypothetical protein
LWQFSIALAKMCIFIKSLPISGHCDPIPEKKYKDSQGDGSFPKEILKKSFKSRSSFINSI